MLPLSPVEHPELSTEEEQLMTQEVADALFDQLNDDICDLLSEYIANVLEKHNIDLDSRLADDLYTDIANRIEINVKVVK
jgi:hypothetical protein